MARRIPVTTVTGFLGAGKTTLLSNLLQEASSVNLAIVVNEFGEASIDSALFRGDKRSSMLEIHELTNALVAYGDDDQFYPAMRKIAAHRNRIDHVLIETSGLALPTAVMEALEGPELSRDFVLDATLTVVDTPLLIAGEFDPGGAGSAVPKYPFHESVVAIFERQLEYADVVVLNKIDALDGDALLKAEARVRSRAPGVRFIELAYGARLDLRLTLGLRLHEPVAEIHPHPHDLVRSAPTEEARLEAFQTQFDGHSHSGLGRHMHGLFTHKHFHEHDPGWMSFALRSGEPQEVESLKAALARTASEEPVLRAKGFAWIEGSDRRLLVQAVRLRINSAWDSSPVGDSGSEIVFIGYHLSRQRVAELLSRITGTHWK